MKIDIQAISDKGRVRENNEDALSIGGVFLRDEAMNLTVDVQENSVFYLLVSDGMGGHEKGEEASEIILDEMKEQFAMNEIRPDTFCDDINEAGKYISYKLNNAAYYQGQLRPMGCTLTGVVWHYGKIYLINAGDSRTYRFRGGILRQLTTDQTERGITDNPQASKALLNCIGGGLDGKILTDDITNKIIDDDVILICSDGLTDMLTDDEIEAMLTEGITTDGMEKGLAEKLKEKACESGGYDNISIILANCKP
jgi:protein phosphatase